MSRFFRLAAVGSITIKIHWSVYILPLFALALGWYRYGGTVGLFDLVSLCLVFLSVASKELLQVVLQRRLGIHTYQILLYPFWGIHRLNTIDERFQYEYRLGLLGPILYGFYASILALAAGVLHQPIRFELPEKAFNYTAFGAYFFWMNVVLMLMNLLPFLPLSGGYLFRASLSANASRVRATTICTYLTGFGSVVFILVGFFAAQWLFVAIAVLLFFSVNEELWLEKWFVQMREAGETPQKNEKNLISGSQLMHRGVPTQFTGFTWYHDQRLWVCWRNGQPVSAHAIVGE
ncbi:MAG: hypothetical protein R3B84_11460 [Zavarzinella sp.]